MSDLVSWVMVRAIDLYHGRDTQTFNGACFAAAWKEIAGIERLLDGRHVAAMLHGRDDVRVLIGGSHYQVIGDRRA